MSSGARAVAAGEGRSTLLSPLSLSGVAAGGVLRSRSSARRGSSGWRPLMRSGAGLGRRGAAASPGGRHRLATRKRGGPSSPLSPKPLCVPPLDSRGSCQPHAGPTPGRLGGAHTAAAGPLRRGWRICAACVAFSSGHAAACAGPAAACTGAASPYSHTLCSAGLRPRRRRQQQLLSVRAFRHGSSVTHAHSAGASSAGLPPARHRAHLVAALAPGCCPQGFKNGAPTEEGQGGEEAVEEVRPLPERPQAWEHQDLVAQAQGY